MNKTLLSIGTKVLCKYNPEDDWEVSSYGYGNPPERYFITKPNPKSIHRFGRYLELDFEFGSEFSIRKD